jgi:hypothetical protein
LGGACRHRAVACHPMPWLVRTDVTGTMGSATSSRVREPVVVVVATVVSLVLYTLARRRSAW